MPKPITTGAFREVLMGVLNDTISAKIEPHRAHAIAKVAREINNSKATELKARIATILLEKAAPAPMGHMVIGETQKADGVIDLTDEALGKHVRELAARVNGASGHPE